MQIATHYQILARKKANQINKIKQTIFVLDTQTGQYAKNTTAKSMELQNTRKAIKTAGIILRELQKSETRGDHRRTEQIKQILEKMRAKENPFKIWNAFAALNIQFAEEKPLLQLIEKNAKGKVLDFCSGLGGYVKEKKGETQVTAIDATREMLERNPASKRILCDVNQIAKGKRLPFEDGEFDSIVGMYAMNYMENPTATLHELARIIKPNGKIMLAGSPTSGVPELVKRTFSSDKYRETLASLGFEIQQIKFSNSNLQVLIATKR